jgi:hypothetical protein
MWIAPWLSSFELVRAEFMKTSTLIFGIAFLFISIDEAGLLCHQPAQTPDGANVASKKIPIESIFSTATQKGTQRVDHGQGYEGFRFELRELYRRSSRIGASNVFLVRGNEIGAAVKATLRVFDAGVSADQPVSPNLQRTSEQIWCVAFFGLAGSSPAAWQVRSVELRGKELRVVYRDHLDEAGTDDVHAYSVWIPLGQIAAGTYSLQLFDETRQHISLARAVVVPPR